jgi:tRNA(Ile2) C34 agmatinyltransferase TiaS
MPPDECRACGGSDFGALGKLGNRYHWRCRDCGLDCSTDADHETPHEIPDGYSEA